MFMRVSLGTRDAKKRLKDIGGERELNKFVNADFKQLSGNISNAGTFFTYANIKSQRSLETFADKLNDADKMQKFLDAIKKQARSLGTKKSGLFYKLIYKNIYQKIKDDQWKENKDLLKLFEKEIRKFLLTKKDEDIYEGDEEKTAEGLDKLTPEEKRDPDKKGKNNESYRRKNNSSIVAKLKSSRLSNRLKVFIALVLWKYVTDRIKKLNQQSKSNPIPTDPPANITVSDQKQNPVSESGSEGVEHEKLKIKDPHQQPQSNPIPTDPPTSITVSDQKQNPVSAESGSGSVEREKPEIKDPHKLSRINGIIPKIVKIHSFQLGGADVLSDQDQINFATLNSLLDSYFDGEDLKSEHLVSAFQQDLLNLDEIEKLVSKVWPLVNKTTVKDLKSVSAKELSVETETQLVQDLIKNFEKGDKNLEAKKTGFREIVNHAKRADGDLDLSFQEQFFEQTFDAPYRTQDTGEICHAWEVKDTIKVGSYHSGCEIERKLKEILSKWFPNCTAEDHSGETPIIKYIFDYRFEQLINGKKDAFSPKLFVKILYSFEQEAARLKVTPSDFNNLGDKAKSMTNEQSKLREFWSGAKTVLISMAPGCCVQVQKAINKIAEYYDAYQISKNNAVDDSTFSLWDRKLCQMLREEATNKAVSSCRVTQDGGSAPDYARLIKSIFTPLVNVADSGYHSEPSLTNFGETYNSLAVKWKEAISSFELIKSVFKKICLSMDNIPDQIDELKKEQISYSEFISVVKSTDKSGRSAWEKDVKKFHSVLKKLATDDVEDSAKKRLKQMENWIYKGGKFSIYELQQIILDDFFEYEDKFKSFKIYKLINDEDTSRTVAYISHLQKSGLITINA